ncbi:hypothetical protein CFI10_14775 [Marinobacterium iners]|uniref:hypothetical protein n=1 Tax=Marinobacterium TaxID=48075 RepID=UPI001A8E3065|nr:hypothetical protein [Marinobacterium iners]QSR36229.1 hypothetical protein CFI10_14775 [Marinobacterium iners]
MRIRSYIALLLYLMAFVLSAVARADQLMPMVMPVDESTPALSQPVAMAEHAGHLVPSRSTGCAEHQRLSGDDSYGSTCQNTPDCSPDHCFSSQGLLSQPLGVMPYTAREYFSSGGYQLLSLVLAPPGRPPRNV